MLKKVQQFNSINDVNMLLCNHEYKTFMLKMYMTKEELLTKEKSVSI